MTGIAKPTIDDIRRAAEAIKGQVVRTPFVSAPRLAKQLGLASLRLKLENQQFTGSFKDRGAYYKLKSLTPEEAKRGVIAMSAGNHAQGVAYHAQRLGIPATIVMPEQTPFTKIERTAAFGPRVILNGDSIDAAAVYARELAAKENLVFVHPYDDPYIVAGQGTIGLEILEDDPDLDFLVIPIGGGGLIGGISTVVKALKPSIEIYGVESDLYPSMHHAINEIPPANGGQTLADGIAVKSPGALTRAIVEQNVREVLLVDEMTVERAVGTLIETQRIVAEGAGAAGIAAILCHPVGLQELQGRGGDRRRQHRFAPAVADPDAHPGAGRAHGDPPDRDHRPARRHVDHHQGDRPDRGQHHGHHPSPAVRRPAGQARRDRRAGRDAQR